MFLWNSRPDNPSIGYYPIYNICFNPCFCGTRARTKIPVGGTRKVQMFQSLFLWNSRPDRIGRYHREYGHYVSILVFVELAPGPRGDIPIDIVAEFQSLFLWNSRPDDNIRYGASEVEVFQSLFLWNSRPDNRRPRKPAVRLLVSILVFVELAPGLCDRRRHAVCLGFQSLFLWNSRPDSTYATHSSISSSTCFNPCFCGTRARTASDPDRTRCHILFQSLFLWNSRPDKKGWIW